MAIRSQLEIDTIIGNGQDSLGDLALKIAKQKNSGLGYPPEMKDDTYRLILVDGYLRIIIDPDTEGIEPNLLLPANEVKLNKLLDAIYKLSDIFDVPGVPITGRRRPPLVLAAVGVQGAQGVPGTDGTNANIEVASDPDYDNISVVEEVVNPLLTRYLLGYAPYTLPQAFIAIQGTKIKEIGDVVDSLTIIVGSIKGRELITDREITSPGGIVLTNVDINDPGLQQENVVQTNVGSNTTYVLEVTDADAETVTTSDSISFVYPFLSGDTAGTSIDHYQDLDKLIEAKSTKQITFNGTNKYFWFGYVATYGTLLRIRDQNGFDVTAEFTSSLVSVNSANLDNNWTGVSFRFYRTTFATTITNGTYTFEFA